MWRYLLLLPVYFLTTALPLATSVGANLEYEYALLVSLAALVLIPLAAIVMPKAALPVEGGAYSLNFGFEVFWIALIGPALALALPAAAYLTKLCPCSAPGFAFWMALLAYPAWILAHAGHAAILRSRVAGWSRTSLFSGLVIGYLTTLAMALLVLWRHPQKRLVHLLLGFLHGPVYDDWIAVDGGIILARASHLFLGLLLLVLAWYRRKASIFAALLALTMLWAVSGSLAMNYYSTRNDQRSLNELLYATVAGDGYNLHYRPVPSAKTGTRGHPAAVQRLSRDIQFHLTELRQVLGADGAHLPTVEIYAYPDAEKKKLWFGGGATDVTDVRTPSIHVELGQWPHPTLRHELVHALASGFGFHGLGFHPNLAFTEGLAVALAPTPGALSLDAGAASLLDSGRIGNIEDLFSPAAFWQASGGRAYTIAGSLINYLIAKHGIAGVKALYGGADWQTAFGRSESDILGDWRQHVHAAYDKNRVGLYTEALYRSGGLFQDACPHSRADLSHGRNDGIYTRLRQPIGWDPDTDLQPWLLALDPSDSDSRLRAWRKEVRRLATDRFLAMGRLGTWREALGHARVHPPTNLTDVDLAITESDIARLLGDTEGSVGILRALREANSKTFFGDGAQREIEARLAVEEQIADPALAGEWRRYLAGWRRIPEVEAQGSPWILTYLRLRNEHDGHLNAAATARLMSERAVDPKLPTTFHHEWFKIIGHRLMRLGAYKDAAQAYSRAAAAVADTAPATKSVFEEHARRAQYYASLGPLLPSADGDEGDSRSH